MANQINNRDRGRKQFSNITIQNMKAFQNIKSVQWD